MKQHTLLMASSAHHDDDACPDDGVIEGTAVQVTDEPAPENVIEVQAGWSGETPFYLVMELDGRAEGNIGVDLDTPWLTTYAEHLRDPGTWWLIAKSTHRPVLSVVVQEGDQPYFTKYHVGNLMSQQEILMYGLGKKRPDGTMVRLWAMPNGVICGGDDMDIIASRMLGTT
jgi:hypothetical protein